MHSVDIDLNMLSYIKNLEQFPLTPPLVQQQPIKITIAADALEPSIDLRAPIQLKSAPLTLKKASGLVLFLYQLVTVWQDLTLREFMSNKLPDLYKYQIMSENTVCEQMSQDRPPTCYPRFYSLSDFNQYLNLFRTANQALQESLQKRYGSESFYSLTFKINIGSGSASCGYHAVCNVQILLQFLTESDQKKQKDTLSNLMNIEYHLDRFGLAAQRDIVTQFRGVQDGIWRQWIINNRSNFLSPKNISKFAELMGMDKQVLKYVQDFLADANGEWLTIYGIKALIGAVHDPSFLKQPYSFPNMLSPEMPIFMHNEIPDDYKKYRQFGIIFHDKTSNHWYGAAVLKLPILTTTGNTGEQYHFILVDSKNLSRYQDTEVIAVLEKILNATQADILKYLKVYSTYKDTKPKFADDINAVDRIQRLSVLALQFYDTIRFTNAPNFTRARFTAYLRQAGWALPSPTAEELKTVDRLMQDVISKSSS